MRSERNAPEKGVGIIDDKIVNGHRRRSGQSIKVVRRSNFMVSAVPRIPRALERLGGKESRGTRLDPPRRLCQLSLSVVNLTVDRSQWRRFPGTGIIYQLVHGRSDRAVIFTPFLRRFLTFSLVSLAIVLSNSPSRSLFIELGSVARSISL